MIIKVLTRGTDSQKFAKVALETDQVLYTKDADGSFQSVTEVRQVQPDTQLFIDLDMFLDIFTLAEHFDLMIRVFGKEGVCLAIDSKGGGFKQR